MKKVSSGIVPIITIDREAPKPLYRQVYDAYRTSIVNGGLRAGQRVPSTRILAAELGISRIPILNAYGQLLAEGYFEGRVGSGTIVSQSLPDQISSSFRNSQKTLKARPGPRPLSKGASVVSSGENVQLRRRWGAFAVSQVASEHFPFRIWNSLVTRHCRRTSGRSLDYGNPLGLKVLREAIATYLRTARGVRCEAGQIMIVSGSQQGLEITTRVLLDPGSSVWMEEPGYRLARGVFALNGCRMAPVPVDYLGLNVALGSKLCGNARAALVTPSHQYPLGIIMSASRRLQLLDWAETSGSWIIEDDYDSEYRYDNTPIASLQGMDRNSRVIYIGTFSKVLFPSLRLGYVVIPPDLIKHFVAVRLAMDIAPAGFYQAVLADFILEGHFSRHVRRMRSLYRDRASVLVEAVRKELGFGVDITGGQAGMHVAITLKGICDREIADRAADQNLTLVPLSSSYLSKPTRQGFILGFGGVTAGQIPLAVCKLSSLLNSK
jgi:GntR family transcriptional regulator/MocR family aminotransferase